MPTAALSEFEPMLVSRVTDDSRSSIFPPLDDSWDDLTKLRWQAGVVLEDVGVAAHIHPYGEGNYSFRLGRISVGGFNYEEAWTFLTGVQIGIEASRDGVPA